MLVLKEVKTSAGRFVLGPISFEMKREYLIILGPSGAGKSLLLEVIAGFRKCEGKIFLNGVEITNYPPEKRRIGFLMQDPLLFPHKNVIENIKFGAGTRDISSLIEKLKISAFADRDVNSLSGGEKQRVALARALASNPLLLLLDEPFSWLDRETREIIEGEVKSIANELNLPVIHVTHNFEEALSLGDRIIILKDGKVVQDSKPEYIFKNPANEFVARFTGNPNIYAGNILVEGERMFFVRENLKFFLGKTVNFKDGPCQIIICPQELIISSHPFQPKNPEENIVEGVVSSLSFMGNFYKVGIEGKIKITAYLSPQEVKSENIIPSKKVFVIIPPEAIKVIDGI
jgi:ABC-type Fe3+/spermidine/putrescine transport system ATPase subunit